MTKLNELTMKELSKIAKENNIALSVTINGKRKRYTKPELIEKIESSLIKKSSVYGNTISNSTLSSDTIAIEDMIRVSKLNISKGNVESVKMIIEILNSKIKDATNSLLINKLSKTLTIIKSLLIMNKLEVK